VWKWEVGAFVRGVVCGIAVTVFVAALLWWRFSGRDRKGAEAWRLESEARGIVEDYAERGGGDFVDGFPGVGDAVRAGRDEFDRKRDEALRRIRGGRVD